MPHAVVYIVDNPARVHTGKRIRTRRGVVWIAWTPTVEDARAVAGINDGRWSKLAVGYDLDGRAYTRTLGEITALIEARAAAMGVRIIGTWSAEDQVEEPPALAGASASTAASSAR